MSRYNKLIKQILDGIFEGYKLEDGKLVIFNEEAAKSADSAIHKLVLEKSRDLWDVLESAEGSLADVAEEISFEELNMDASSLGDTGLEGVNAVADEPANPAVAAPEPTLENLLGSDDFNLDSIFEMGDINEPPMADGGRKDEPTMMDAVGDDEDDLVDGDEENELQDAGLDDAGMGSSDLVGDDEDLGGLEMGDEEPEGDMDMDMDMEPNGDMDMEPNGDMDMEPNGDEGDAFDFDLLEPVEGGEENGEEGALDLGDEEEEDTEEGRGDFTY